MSLNVKKKIIKININKLLYERRHSVMEQSIEFISGNFSAYYYFHYFLKKLSKKFVKNPKT